MSTNLLQCVTSITSDPNCFFSYGEILDYHMAGPKPSALKESKQLLLGVLGEMEEVRDPCHYLSPALTMFKLLHNEVEGILVANPQMLKYCSKSETIKVVHNILERLVGIIPVEKRNQSLGTDILKKIATVEFEMTIKVLLNILYLLARELTKEDLDLYNRDKDLEETLLKLIQCSLEYQFVPIKKVLIFFHWVIATKFQDAVILSQDRILSLSDNIVTEEMIHKSLSEPPRLLATQRSVVEVFFAKYNINECVIAQTIVVGLLRALLNSCNAKPVPSSNGVDIYKEWRVSYIYASNKEEKLPEYLRQILKEYKEWSQESQEKGEVEAVQSKSVIQQESDRHRMYTAWAITSFFAYLLTSFRQNQFIQYTYFIQLMSDANGVLVLLKFLTDKFAFSGISPLEIFSKATDFPQNFKKVIATVLILLEAACKNSPEKIKNYLLVYNGFLIFKKIPSIMGEDPAINTLVYSLLKIQLPYLSKKTKESSNNTKMVTDIYCKYPSKPQPPRVLTNYDRLRLKNKVKPKHQRELVMPEDVKNAHLEFNNHHYWHLENQQARAPQRKEQLLQRLEREVRIPEDFDYQKWLQDNVWGYYD